MMRWLLRRFVILLLTLVGIMILTFLLTRLTPGDPAAMRLGGASGAAVSTGAYDQLLELNRQNLGLDKPILLNLRFDTPESRIHEAIGQSLRTTEFWRDSGERRLVRHGMTAVLPIIERYEAVGSPSAPPILQSNGQPADDVADPEEQRARLVALLPRVAANATTATLALPPEEQVAWWKSYVMNRRASFFHPEATSVSVQEYLAAGEEERGAALVRIREHGSNSIAPLMLAMRRDDATIPAVTEALEAVTGIAYSDEEPAALRARWETWWRRTRTEFVDPGPVESMVRVLTETQFGVWIGQAVRLDFGDSYATRRPVRSMIAEALPVSVVLSALSILLSYLLAIPIGVFSALKRHTPADRLITLILFVLYSLPSFWVAGIMILTLTGPPFLTVFPTRGLTSPGMELQEDWGNALSWSLDAVWHLVLPVTCLTYGSLAFISRQMRSSMLETINQDFIRTAVAKGVSPIAVVWKHAVRNSLLPIITISAGILPELIAGAVIIESIFTLPGMGSLTFTAILNRDYPVINAVLLFSAFLTLVGILLADLAYSLADPRIEYR